MTSSPPHQPRIAFFGTPVFAAEILKYLYLKGHHICCVITAPDKPAGRGQKLSSSQVKQCAEGFGIPVLQPENLKDPSFEAQYKAFMPDISVVIAFRMLPEVVWRLPSLGTFNLHASLLPQYRGAAPINRAIMNGETITGLTTFLIDQQIDTGNVLMQIPMTIDQDETAGELHDRMMAEGATLVEETIRLLASGHASPKQQDLLTPATKLLQAPKIFKEETRIDWSVPAQAVYNKIRGLSPYPAAFTTIIHPEKGTFDLKIFRAAFIPGNHHIDHPEILSDQRTEIKIVLQDGEIELLEIQLQGRKRLKAEEFLRGFSLDSGWKLAK